MNPAPSQENRINGIKEFLEELNWKYTEKADAVGSSFTHFIIPDICQALYAPRMEQLCQGLLHLNSAISIDISNGFIQFKFSLPSFCVISVEQFNEIVENVVNTVDQFYPLIMKLQWSDTSPSELLDDAVSQSDNILTEDVTIQQKCETEVTENVAQKRKNSTPKKSRKEKSLRKSKQSDKEGAARQAKKRTPDDFFESSGKGLDQSTRLDITE